ncbi:MAG TPA: SRPBCC family protein [Nitrococcus sp.]|nr:SRPBCC family protein [Nitrococcus sp.]
MDIRAHEGRPSYRQPAGYRNVSDQERKASLIAGAGSLLFGLRRGGVFGLTMGALGGLLGYRGLTGHCPVFARLGKSTAKPTDRGLFGTAPVDISTGVTINREPQDLYQFWRGFTRLPTFMKYITEVQPSEGNRTHWVAESPIGGKLEWESEVVEDVPNERIIWRTTEDSRVAHRGEIRFRPAPAGRGTEVELDLHYEVPGGKLGQTWKSFAKFMTEQAIREDLRRFKRLMEAREIPTNAVTSIASRQRGPQ